MLSELRRLVGDNGLFVRPGLSEDGESTWEANGYGLSALAAAGAQDLSLRDAGSLQSSLDAKIDSDPVWGRWYAVVVEQATGTKFEGDWADGILVEPFPGDAATRIAAVAAVADVIKAKALPISTERRAAFASLLAEARTAGPYTRCRALQAAAALSLDPSGWSIQTSDDLTLPSQSDPAAIMDVYGNLCLAKFLDQPPDEAARQRVLRWLEPHLTVDVAGAEFEGYFVVQAWLAAGGEPARLAPLIRKFEERRDPNTGLLRERVTRLGTLESTYQVAVLAETVDAFADLTSDRVLRAVRDLVPRLRARSALVDLLMAAVVLHYADQPDPALESEAAEAAERWLGSGITRENVIMASRITLLLQQLGRRVPTTHASVFAPTGAESRYLAWSLLGIAHYLDNGDEVRRELAAAVSEIDSALSDPDLLMVNEVTAAMSVAGSQLDRNDLPPALTRWAREIRGCDGFRTLYRPVRSEPRCSLEATVQMINAGLARP
jgi:hypothetical protein